MFTVGSLFSGIGGIDLAFEAAGFDIAYQVEINDYCTQVLQKHWRNVRRNRDIFECRTLPPTDVITAGFPCQPFSVAGQQRGEQDERFLWPEILRVVAANRPRVVFLENVPGLRTNDGGRTFKRVLRELAEIGYDAQWHHLWAKDVGAPHPRERLFIVAHTERFRQSEPRCAKQPPYHQKRNRATYQQAGIAELRPIVSGGQILANTNGKRRQKPRWPQRLVCAKAHSRKSYHQLEYASRWQSQSRLGRGTNGIPHRLDTHQWPALQGQPQYKWESPRIAPNSKINETRREILGNAVVPQVVLPIARAIREYLE